VIGAAQASARLVLLLGVVVAVVAIQFNRRNPAAYVQFERMAERFRRQASLGSSAFRSPIHRFFENTIWPSRS
jgi:hypothetical protein